MTHKNSAIITLLTCVFVFAILGLMHKRNNRLVIEPGLASINKSGIIVYSGRNRKSDKLWKLNHKNWPVIILETSKNWIKITDFYNTTGWIEKQNIGKPYALIKEDCYAIESWQIQEANGNSKLAAKLLANSIIEFLGPVNEKYCKINLNGKKKAFIECSKLLYKI